MRLERTDRVRSQCVSFSIAGVTKAVLVFSLIVWLAGCTVGGYRVRVNRPSFGVETATPTSAMYGDHPTEASGANDSRARATATHQGLAPNRGAPTPELRAPAAGVTRYVDPEGHFEISHGDSWSVEEPPVEEGIGAVTWLLRLERGEPGADIPSGDVVPPDGATLDVGVVEIEPGVDLAEWAESELPVDRDEMSVTADAMASVVGAEGYATIFREGQILPYFGRWREWMIPDPRQPGRVYVVRATAYGHDDQWEMAHSKVVARTLALP